MRLTRTLRRRGRFAGGLDPTVIARGYADAMPEPKVIVWRESPGCWLWIIGRRVGPNGYVRPAAGPGGTAPTQPAALALGLAALDTATHRAKVTT